MIIEVFKDMLPFLVILLIGIFGFADAFLSIEQITDQKETELVLIDGEPVEVLIIDGERVPPDSIYMNFLYGYISTLQQSYEVAIGEGSDRFEKYNQFDWLIFMLCTLFNVIILLNLLIAIISETFTRVNDTAVQYNFFEKTLQSVSIMHTFIWTYDSNPTEMLFIVRETMIKDEEDTNQDVKEQI